MCDTHSTNSALLEIDRTLINSNDSCQHHLFRTFLLIKPNGTPEEWEEFRKTPLPDSLAKAVKNLPIFTILMLFKRHKNEMPFFLKYFDTTRELRSNPKSYLPTLEAMIDELPIQWIVSHTLRIEDVRYAYHFLNTTFNNYIKLEPMILETRDKREAVYEQYKKLVPIKSPLSFDEAWKKMLLLRSSMRELMDIKLKVSFASYERLVKSEFVKRFLNYSSCEKVERYTVALKNQMIPFCTINNISIQPIIISTMAHKDWTVHQKLGVIQEFIFEPDQRKNALRSITFTSKNEIDEIESFAKKNKIDFEPDPSRYQDTTVKKPQQKPQQRKISRSPSIGFTNVDNPTERSPLYLELYRLSPKSVSSGVSRRLAIFTSISQLANGEPNVPSEYADKLENYKILQEIEHIYILAKEFNIVVKYEDFLNADKMKQLFVSLLKMKGADSFKRLMEIFSITNDELMNVINNFKELFLSLASLIVEYVQRSNFGLFLNFMTKGAFLNANESNLTEISRTVYTLLLQVIDKAQSSILSNVIFLINTFKGFLVSKSSEAEKIEIMKYLSKNDFAPIINILKKNDDTEFLKCAFPYIVQNDENISKEEFLEQISSNDTEKFVIAFAHIKYLGSNIVEYLTEAKSRISGLHYSRLEYIMTELSKHGIEQSKELKIVHILYASKGHSIDYHLLIQNPLKVLSDMINTENYNELSPIADLLSIEKDELLMNLITEKITSNYFDDYSPFISQITDHDKYDNVLLEIMPKKLKCKEELKFFEFIGRIDIKKKKETSYDLISFSLNEFLNDKYLNDPTLLIFELYKKKALYEKLGGKLQELTSKIAQRYCVDISVIRANIIHQWLCENKSKVVKEPVNIFSDLQDEIISSDDQICIQKCIFVLRSVDIKRAAYRLLNFITNMPNITYRAKFNAMICLLSFTDIKNIKEIFSDKFDDIISLCSSLYYVSRLEIYGIQANLSDFEKNNVLQTVKFYISKENLEHGALPVLYELCINYHIQDKSMLLFIIKELIKYRQKFILQNISGLFDTFPEFSDDKEFNDLFHIIVSLPINEIITNPSSAKTFKTQHTNVFHEYFNIISNERASGFSGLFINNELLRWEDIIGKLCDIGFSQLAAKMGAYIIDIDQRNKVLHTLLQHGHYDAALEFGFDHDLIFSIIVNGAIEQATEIMIDEHFVLLTSWLKEHNDQKSLDIIKETLAKQGRTMEIKRMSDRLVKI